VVGLQYLVSMIDLFCTAGLFAMAIWRTELLSPTSTSWRQLVPDGGGRARHHDDDADDIGRPRPVRHYLMPLMIGSKRMAFPRLEALSFWLTRPRSSSAVQQLLGGFPTGWTATRR